MVDFDIIWLDAGLVSLCRHIKSIMPRYDTDWVLLEERKALNRFLTKFASSKNFFGQTEVQNLSNPWYPSVKAVIVIIQW